MGRPAKFDAEQMLDASMALVAAEGPGALSVSAVADSLGAPGASVYHRFRSRDMLAASLWLRTVEQFQEKLLVALGDADPLSAARAAARHVVVWSRQNLAAARLLLLYRSSDLVHGDWPLELRERNDAQRSRIDAAMAALCRGLGARSRASRRRVVFAVIDIPYGAVRGPLEGGRQPNRALELLVDEAVVGLLTPLVDREPSETSGSPRRPGEQERIS